jgi:signal transduction histidine kinase
MSIVPTTPSASELRILVFAPTANDARLTADFLAAAGLQAEVAQTVVRLGEMIEEGCGAILLAEEALASRDIERVFARVKQQPAWSDIPIALITTGGEASEQRLRRLAHFGAESSVTLLERPFRPGTLISTIEVALRSRRRQYEVRRLLTEVGNARDAAEHASRAKDEFLAALSHELRTPLNPVLLLATEAADNPTLPPAIRDEFALIARNVLLEARLIDDLLDLTRITRGKLVLDRQPVDAHVILREALANTQTEISEKSLHVETSLQARGVRVMADAVRLQQVFWNVLKNAAKFTPRGGRLRIETRDDVPAGELVLRFIDSGVGMTSAEIKRVFETFAQGDHASEHGGHRFGGLGLGLAISRMLTELHGGRITATSEGPNQGATFEVRLRTLQQEKPGQSPATTPENSESRPAHLSGGRRVLLVEDHEPTRTSLAKLLTRRGYDVRTAGSLAEARALVATASFDLLLSDLGLPDGNGCELMDELRRTHPIPGIALSGYGMDQDVAQSREAGFGTHLIKPVSVHVLEKALAQIEAGNS